MSEYTSLLLFHQTRSDSMSQINCTSIINTAVCTEVRSFLMNTPAVCGGGIITKFHPPLSNIYLSKVTEGNTPVHFRIRTWYKKVQVDLYTFMTRNWENVPTQFELNKQPKLNSIIGLMFEEPCSVISEKFVRSPKVCGWYRLLIE